MHYRLKESKDVKFLRCKNNKKKTYNDTSPFKVSWHCFHAYIYCKTQTHTPKVLLMLKRLYCHICFQEVFRKKQGPAMQLHPTVTLVLRSKTDTYLNQKTLVPGFNSTWTVNFQMFKAHFRKGRGTRDQTANIRWIIEKSKRVPEKHLFLLCWLCQSLWLCGSHETVENS